MSREGCEHEEKKKRYQYHDVKFTVVMPIGNVPIWNLTNTQIADNGRITMIC